MKNRLRLFFIILMVFISSAQADEREFMRYNDLLQKFKIDKFFETPISQRDKIKAYLTVRPSKKGIGPTDLVLTIDYSAGKEIIPVSPEGLVSITLNSKWKIENPMIFINQSKGQTTEVGIALEPIRPKELQFSYVTLMGSVGQANGVFKNLAGIFRFFFPKIIGLEFKFAKPGGQTLRIQSKNGVKILTANGNGELIIKPDDALLEENPIMILSDQPIAFDFVAS